MAICREHAKSAKLKSRLKQIGATVALYFENQEVQKYPINPRTFNFPPNFFYTNKTKSWNEININSPYYFFPDETISYSGAPTVPLATNWEPILKNGTEFFAVVWEDGHVSQVTKKERDILISSSFKGISTQDMYRQLAKNNQVLQ